MALQGGHLDGLTGCLEWPEAQLGGKLPSEETANEEPKTEEG